MVVLENPVAQGGAEKSEATVKQIVKSFVSSTGAGDAPTV